jgi:hypothetical protein
MDRTMEITGKPDNMSQEEAEQPFQRRVLYGERALGVSRHV